MFSFFIPIKYCLPIYFFSCNTGKNNVMVLPKESSTPVAGYLSLHSYGSSGLLFTNNISTQQQQHQPNILLHLKWTPNRLMNVDTSIEDKNASWQQAVNIDINTILFLHCHQVRKRRQFN